MKVELTKNVRGFGKVGDIIETTKQKGEEFVARKCAKEIVEKKEVSKKSTTSKKKSK